MTLTLAFVAGATIAAGLPIIVSLLTALAPARGRISIEAGRRRIRRPGRFPTLAFEGSAARESHGASSLLGPLPSPGHPQDPAYGGRHHLRLVRGSGSAFEEPASPAPASDLTSRIEASAS